MSKRQQAPRLSYHDYCQIRLDLLRACLQSLLAFFVKPTAARRREWETHRMNYSGLTESSPIEVWRIFGLKSFRKGVGSAKRIREDWFTLLRSVKEADKKLGDGSNYYARFLDLSPFAGMTVIWVRYVFGPHKEERRAPELLEARRKHGIPDNAIPAYICDGHGYFMAFRNQPATAKKSAA